jgi:feruloyl esterase
MNSFCSIRLRAAAGHGSARRDRSVVIPLAVLVAALLSAKIAGATECALPALQALNVAHVTIKSAKMVPAAASKQAYCDIAGSMATDGEGAGPSSAGFTLTLPASWNGKYMFGGGRGTGGMLASSANKPDIDTALERGYASVTTDSGHSNSDKDWYYSGKTGVPNVPRLTDYYYRATHQVTLATKDFVKAYYGGKAIARAYFNGCSNGGRQAITEAVRYPDDYDGIIVGCPWLDPAGSALLNVQRTKSFLDPARYIPLNKFTEIDTAVLAKCDGLDGVEDGLIQNPANCDFDPHSIVPGVLTKQQADALDRYLDAVRDEKGNLIAPGSSVSRLQAAFNGVRNNPDGTPLRAMLYESPAPFPTAAAPWGEGKNESHNWNSARGVVNDLAYNDPSFDLNNGLFEKSGPVKPDVLKDLYNRLGVEIVADPAKLQPFLRRGGKILMYHGLSDVTISGYGTILYYEALAQEGGGYEKIGNQVRLFLVSGMQHCNDGPDPVFFDTLTAMENWVEQDQAPNTMLATYTANWGKKVTRTLPLCKFPVQARYSGSGDVNDAKNWTCPDGDRGMLEVSRNGAQAGMKDDLRRYTARFKSLPPATMKQ